MLDKDTMELMICEFLNCGILDLRVLKDFDFDTIYVSDILSEMKDCNVQNDFNYFVYFFFGMAADRTQDAIIEEAEEMIEVLEEGRDRLEEEIEEFEEGTEEYECKEAELEVITEELELIEDLKENLYLRDDLDSYHNYLDTHAGLRGNYVDILTDKFEKQLGVFEQLTGFSLI